MCIVDGIFQTNHSLGYSLKMHSFWLLEFFGQGHRWTLRKKINKLLLAFGVPTRDQHEPMDNRGHVAIECSQDIFVAKWTPVDTDLYDLFRQH